MRNAELLFRTHTRQNMVAIYSYGAGQWQYKYFYPVAFIDGARKKIIPNGDV
jgi:hypothetical protein